MNFYTDIGGWNVKHSRITENPVMAFDFVAILICMVLLPSAVLHGFLGTDERTVFGLGMPILLFVAFIYNRLYITKKITIVIFLVMITAIVSGAVAEHTSQILMGGALSVSILAGSVLCMSLQRLALLRAVSIFTLILLVGGLVGIIYTYLGGGSLYEIKVGYRTTGLYISTFSFANVGGLIRPSGIFDEPGAFVMFAAIVTMFNDILRQNHRLNIAIVLLLILTGSLVGVMLLLLYLIASNFTSAYRKKSFVFTMLFMVFLSVIHFSLPSNPISTALDTFYSERLEVEDGRLVGDNRTGQVEEFFSIVNDEILSRGANVVSGTFNHYDQSSNPFSIVYGYGFIISIPYFLLLAWLLFIPFKHGFKNSYASVGMLIILLQRPYIYNMLWSAMIAAALILLHSDLRKRHSTAINYANGSLLP